MKKPRGRPKKVPQRPQARDSSESEIEDDSSYRTSDVDGDLSSDYDEYSPKRTKKTGVRRGTDRYHRPGEDSSPRLPVNDETEAMSMLLRRESIEVIEGLDVADEGKMYCPM